jgi:hypothetical protein
MNELWNPDQDLATEQLHERIMELEQRIQALEGTLKAGEQIIINHTKTIDYIIQFLSTVFHLEDKNNGRIIT